MARIPVQIGDRRLDTGSVVQYSGGGQVGAALAQAGQQVANTAINLGERYQHRAEQVEKFKTLRDFDAFGTEIQTEADKAKQTMEPGATGLHNRLVETYDKKSTEWLGKVPPNLRPEFEARVVAQRAEFSRSAALLEKTEAKRFQESGIVDRAKQAESGVLAAGPAAMDTWIKDVHETIDAAPDLSPVEKAIKKKAASESIRETGFRALAAQDPEEAMRVAKGWGIDKGFSGTAVDRTMQVLRDKEGFKSSTYWDVNAHRVGYGSDTITAADGSVRPVKQGDTVTRADAERDLKRRTGEFLAGVRSSVGEEAFNRLNPNQQAALGSVAYNYGSLPDSVAAAARTGDASALSRSIEGLQGHNGGVNRTRRLSEAALARSTGDGPVAGVYAPDPRFADVPADRRLVLAGAADLEVRRRAAATSAAETQVYKEKLNSLQTNIIDNKATLADVTKAREEGWLTDASDIMRVTSQIAQRDKGLADTTNFGRAFADPNHAWNPVDSSHKDWAEAGFKSLGGNMQALQTIAEKTGIVPGSAAVAMRGALFSPDAKRVEGALQTAANLVGGRYPDVFAGADGGKELTEAGHTFRHLVYDRGLSAADATKRIMEERTPEYERNVNARIKSEDTNAIVKKELKEGDIRSAFDPSFLGLAPNPALTFNPEMRTRAMGDYEEIFREKFAKNGDVSLAKKLALEEMKTTWGVTSVSGSKTVMKYPPERSQVYAGIENVSEQIAMQAASAIKDLNGVDVDRSKIRMDEVKNTAERYMRGQPPTYVLSYTDKNGHVQTIPKQFYADPGLMRDAQTAARAAQSAKIQTRVAIDADMADLGRANFGVQ